MNEDLRSIEEKWRNQKEYLQEQYDHFQRLQNRIEDSSLTEDEKWDYTVLFSTVLADTYSGFERIFEEIAKRIDDFQRSDKGWHKELLELMTVETDNRDAILSKEKDEVVRELLRFRHMSRKRYPGEINWRELKVARSEFEEYFHAVYEDLESFVDNLEEKTDPSDEDKETSSDENGLDMDL